MQIVEKYKKLFGNEKPLIALLHIRALPGDPRFGRNDTMAGVVESARADLIALQNGGVDAVLFSNEYSFPYQQKVDPSIVGAMGYIIGQLKKHITVPYGVHVISDPIATIDLAAVTEANFVRSVFTGAYAGEAGLRGLNIAATLRRKRALGLDDLLMFYMVSAESDGDLSGRDVKDIARALVFKCQPDGLCVSGKSAGSDADRESLLSVRKAVDGSVPVLCNTGLKKETLRDKLECCDGGFVGTTFKKEGRFENMVDEERVRAFMDLARELRK